jgi:hypothetical protein
MRRFRAFALGLAALALAGTARPQVPLTGFIEVLGNVTDAARPVDNALVIAFNITNFSAIQTFTSSDGTFALPPLKAGIYKIIAVKQGFAPAVAVVTPGRKGQKVALHLQNEKASRDLNQAIWEIRASLPADVLRQLNMVMDPLVQAADRSRIRGEATSLTGVTDQATNPAFAQTTLDVAGRLPRGWEVGFHGNLHRVEDATDAVTFGTPLAQSSVVSLEVKPSGLETYRLASTQSWWRYTNDTAPATPAEQADLRSHNFEWEHGEARFQVRYLGQNHIFASNPAGSDLVEVSGGTTVLQNDRSGLGVSVSLVQENLRRSTAAIYRSANLAADAKYSMAPSFQLRYGMASRLDATGTEWAPRTGAEWKIGPSTSVVFSGQYKVFSDHAAIPPAIVIAEGLSNVLPHYAYSVGVTSADGNGNHLSATASVTAVDSLMRLVFSDGVTQLWDGLYVDPGDVRHDLRMEYRKELRRFAVAVSTAGGTISRARAEQSTRKSYVTGDIESTFQPTGTTVAVSFRQMDQPAEQFLASTAGYRTERMNVRMSQSLHLPVDLKVLLGLELAHAANSPLLLESVDPNGYSRKYIGGLAVSF